MKVLIAFAIAVLAALAQPALAQTQPVTAVLAWTNPTGPLTGIEVHWATAPIADDALTRAPQVTLTGTSTTSTQTIPAANGQTLYFRLRAVNGATKSAYSNQASKLIEFAPGVPSSLTITITIGSP